MAGDPPTLTLAPDPAHPYNTLPIEDEVVIERDRTGRRGIFVYAPASFGFWTDERTALALRDYMLAEYPLEAAP